MRDRSVGSAPQRGLGRRLNAPSRSHKIALLLGIAVLTGLVLSVKSASAVAPILTIDPTPTSSYTTAHVSGTVDPGDNETSVYIEYSKEPATEGWQFSFLEAVPAGSGSTAVSGELTGLAPGTEYLFRLGAENGIEPEVFSPEPNPSITTSSVAPPTVSIEQPSAVTGHTAHFSGTINPDAPAGDPAAFNVEWHFECTPACPGLRGHIPADATDHVISAEAPALQANTAYEVKLIAANAGGSAEAGPESLQTDSVRPVIGTVFARVLASGTSARLGGYVNPENSPTIYWIEYGSDQNYGRSVPVSRDADAGAGAESIPVTEEVTELNPGETYHFRLVAENPTGKSDGNDATFKNASALDGADCPQNEAIRIAQGVQWLSDCRAYEKVSPGEKNGADVQGSQAGPAAGGVQVSPDGGGVAYTSLSAAFAGSPSAGVFVSYLGRRSGSGWTTQPIDPPLGPSRALYIQGAQHPFYTSDLSSGIVETDSVLTEGAGTSSENLYRTDFTSGVTQLVNPGAPPPSAQGSPAPIDVRASTDAGTVAFETSTNYEGTPASSESLKVYRSLGGRLELASILPDEEPAQEESLLGGAATSEHALSTDGSRLYFSAFGPTTRLYLRTQGHTIPVSEPNTSVSDPLGPQSANYLDASADGTKAFFTSSEKLTADATTGSEDHGTDLYEFNLSAPAGSRLTDLSVDTTDPDGAQVQGIIGASDEGSYVYFVALGQIVPGQGTAGAPNLYVRHGGTTTYITTLDPSDSANWTTSSEFAVVDPARVTPSGEAMLFTTVSPQSGYENAGFKEVYLYDAGRNILTCVSCDPSGRPASANAGIAAPALGATSLSVRPENLSVDGRRVFFETTQALVKQDTNGLRDVYEYEDGQVSLISTGTGSEGSIFAGASPNGSDAFFVTRQQLVPTDTDESTDLYDARENGGFVEDRSAETPCVGEACRGGAVQATGPSPVASSNLVGPPNTNPHKAKKKHKPHKKRRHHKNLGKHQDRKTRGQRKNKSDKGSAK